MLKLIEREWGKFLIDNIFEMSTGANVPNTALSNGHIPRISAKDTMNGITCFTSDSKHENFRLNSKCVSVSFLCSAFYQHYTSSYDMKIHSLKIKGREMNKYIGLFIATECGRQFKKFSYGNQLSSKDLLKQNLLLPITPDGKPDWQFMEDYMRQVEHKLLKPVVEKLKERIGNEPLQTTIGGGKWKAFAIKDVFMIKRGKRLKKADHIDGSMPYVSSTSQNNGVDQFIGNINGVRIFGDCITIANSGSVGCSFYHGYKFVASDHVTQLKRSNCNKYDYLFVVSMLKRLSEKYSFNREINDERIERDMILLPVTPEGKPDWQYMEGYMRLLERKLLLTTLNSLEKRII